MPVHELDDISESMSATGPGLDPGVMSSLRDFGALPELGRLVDNEMLKKLLSMGGWLACSGAVTMALSGGLAFQGCGSA